MIADPVRGIMEKMGKIILIMGLTTVIAMWWLLASTAHAQALPEIDHQHISYMIEDSHFTGGFSTTHEDIQEFLEEAGEDCHGDLCLKNYEDEDSGRSGAAIIHDAAREHGINPYVILATLQKEKSLVTAEDPQDWQYRTAMGYGCPDDADCEEDFFGYANQIELATTLLRTGYDRACGNRLSYMGWHVRPQWYKGHVIDIDNQQTYLGNCATASLYNYTPHRVDSAWEPRHNDQYYYGNYNFVLLFHDWYPPADPIESI